VGYALINSSRRIDELGLDDLTIHHPGIRLLTVPATDLAREHVGRPTPNAVLLGAFAAMTGVVSLDTISAALHERFPAAIANANQAGAQAAHAFVERELAMTKEPVRA
jgi:pyruvate ferredoxin oxidoreductase gamma subunit